jgi:hypothetical protein
VTARNTWRDPADSIFVAQVLSEYEQALLEYQQERFMASQVGRKRIVTICRTCSLRSPVCQTWYRPHATDTHRAFSINWALYICAVSCDQSEAENRSALNTNLGLQFIIGNSVFQCMLCGCMWGLNRHQRPAWTTGSLIPLSFGCGIASGILIWKG